MFVPARGDDGGADAGHVGFEADVQGLAAGPSVEALGLLDIADVPDPDIEGRGVFSRKGEAAVDVGQGAVGAEENGGSGQGLLIGGIDNGAGQGPTVLCCAVHSEEEGRQSAKKDEQAVRGVHLHGAECKPQAVEGEPVVTTVRCGLSFRP